MEYPNYYAIIPANVRYDEDLTANAKLLYGEITALSDKFGYCFATNEYFLSLYKLSIRTITDIIKQLENKNYIYTEIKTKRFNDGTIKKERKIIINHIEIRQQDHIENYCENHIEENFSYNNTQDNNKNNNIYVQKFKKPTVEEIQQYCSERNNNIDAEHFFDYYESNGWKIGRNPMKDWKATIRTWERNNYNNKNNEDDYPSIEHTESKEEKEIRYRCGYVAGVFTKEDLEREGIPLPTDEEYADIRSRI